MKALPPSSTAMQNDAEGHETNWRASLGVGAKGADQEVPFQVKAEFKPNTTQNDAEGHETEVKEKVPSMSVGADQEVPFQVRAFPVSSTATQNDAEGHETEERKEVPSTSVGADHVRADFAAASPGSW